MIYQYQPVYPVVSRVPAEIDALCAPLIGLDFEWDVRTEKATIVGVSDHQRAVSVSWSEGEPYLHELVRRISGLDPRMKDTALVGHNVIRAERPMLKKYGLDLPLDRFQDTIIWHYLVNAHLCKAGGKAAGETGAEGDLDRRGPGFMNIWTMCSIHTSLPCWKFCRGKDECVGVPCDVHEPFWYNGIDALGPVQALPDMQRKARLLGVDGLYPLHARLNEQFQIMHERGVYVDVPFIEEMRQNHRESIREIWAPDQKEPTATSLPFNPESWQQAKKYFKETYSFDLENTQEITVRDAVEDLEGLPGVDVMARFLEYKEGGSGPDRWFAPRIWDDEAREWTGYVIDEGGGLGTIHCNLNHFTSTGRTACSNPNLQNVEKRRVDRKTGEKVGKRMRRAIVAPPGYYLYSADYSNGENRVYMNLAGYPNAPADVDFHDWMVKNIGLKETDEFAIRLGNAREASKSVTHASDYLEGLDLLNPEKLRSVRVRQEIAAGARLVFHDWKYKDYVVSFTGANLAQRAFGDKSWANRKRALEVSERYFKVYPKLRDVQRMITKQVESGMVRVPHGYVLQSYDRTPNDMLKTGAAMWGSNPVAHYLKLALLNAESHPRIIPGIPVHDEIVFWADARHDPQQIKKDISECMVFTTDEMPGFEMPIKVKVSDEKMGRNWRDMKEIV